MVLRSITFTTLYFMKKSRLVKLAVFLIIAIAFFSLSFWIVERLYQEQKELFSYWKGYWINRDFYYFRFRYRLSSHTAGLGFRSFFPHNGYCPGWSIYSRDSICICWVPFKKHSAVKNVDFKDHILICGTLTDVKNFISQLFHPDHGKADLQVVFLMPREPSGEMENITGVLNT